MSDLLNPSIERREIHPAPEWVERVCANFGVTESGLPKYRVMWNPDRRRPMNIINPETGQFVQRNPLRYPQIGARWILEVMLPWELYGTWNEAAFGPKPADGEYVLSHIIQLHLTQMMQAPADHQTEFLSLDDFGQDNLALMLYCIDKSRALQAWQMRNFDQEMLEREEAGFHNDFENVYDNHQAELYEIEKLCDQSGLHTSLDPIPEKIEKQRRKAAGQQGKKLIH